VGEISVILSFYKDIQFLGIKWKSWYFPKDIVNIYIIAFLSNPLSPTLDCILISFGTAFKW
jgi:hypothetical protein